jgi:hypothetical protein
MRTVKTGIAALGLVAVSLLGGCSAVSLRGQANFGVKQLFVSQAGNCNNKVLITTGKVDSSERSDGWSMIDSRTNQLTRVAGDSIIVDASQTQISVYEGAPTLAEAQSRLLQQIQQDGTVLKEPFICKRP